MNQILLVEDDILIAVSTSLTLEDGGYRVFHAENAQQAVDALKVGRFAALVTDINLGPGEDGFSVARSWRAINPDKPVVFVSGDDAFRYAGEALQPSELITKPFDPQQILAFLNLRLLH